jgi:hypothetical protein
VRPRLVFLAFAALLPRVVAAGPRVGLHYELPTLHSPMARYSGEDVEHGLPLSAGLRGDLGLGLDEQRWLSLGLGARGGGMDLGTVRHGMLDLAYVERLPGGERIEAHWEAGLGAELIGLLDHGGEALALHLGPRFFGGLGLGLGAGRLQPCLGLRASFTAATGSFDIPDEEIDDDELERFYMPSVLVLAGTVGLRI